MYHAIDHLRRIWWVFLVRGIAAIALGVMAFAWPALTLSVLVILLGAYVLVDGAFGLADAIRHRDRLQRNWPLMLESILGIGIGLLTLIWPGATALAVLAFVAAWAILGGLLRITLAFLIREEITGEWILIVGGVLSVLFGGLLITVPQAGLVALVWIIGLYALLFGGLFLFLAFRLRKLGNLTETYV